MKKAQMGKVDRMVPQKNHYAALLKLRFLIKACSPKKVPNVKPHLIEVKVNGNLKMYFACRKSNLCWSSLSLFRSSAII